MEIKEIIPKGLKAALIKYLVIGLIIILPIVFIVQALFLLFAAAADDEEDDIELLSGQIGYSSYIDATNEDLQYLYALVMHECGPTAENEKFTYVASAVLNRVLCGNYANTIKGVITQPGQFSGAGTNGDEAWVKYFQAVGEYMNSGHTSITHNGINDNCIANAKQACDSVLSGGDTTGTKTHPEGGATTFAGPVYIRNWLNLPGYKANGIYGLFNDKDGKEAEMEGTTWKTGGEWGSLSYAGLKTDSDKLAQYRLTYGSGGAPVSGGIKTQAESDALDQELAAMLHTTKHKYNSVNQQGPFPEEYNTGLQKFQCTWYVVGRANQYLAKYGTKYKKYPTTSGNGRDYYKNNVNGGWFEYGQAPRPNSIISWSGGNYTLSDGSKAGHVAYVEGVNVETGQIFISHAGGGWSWYGMQTIPISGYFGSAYSLNGYIYLDSPK